MRFESSPRWKLVNIFLFILVIVICACGGKPTEVPTPTLSDELIITMKTNLVSDQTPVPTSTTIAPTAEVISEPQIEEQQFSIKNAAEYVVKLNIQNCSTTNKGFKSLTGFFVSGFTGIVTALHGVVDCQYKNLNDHICIRAIVAKTWLAEQKNADISRSYDCLEIIEVDILRDIVHIDSPLLATHRTDFWPQDGLEVVEANNLSRPLNNWRCGINYHEDIFVYGFPGLSKSGIPKIAPVLCVRALVELLTDESQISDNLLGNLIRRRSPDLERHVLHIGNNVLAPGDSGAPILRQRDSRVYGIVLGGIPGLSHVSWAVPWTQLDWKGISDNEVRVELDRLSRLRLDTTVAIDEFDIFWGFTPNFGEDTTPPVDFNTPYLSIDSQPWQGDLPAVVYTPENACIVVLTDNFYALDKATITQMAVNANEFDTNLSIGMTRLPKTSASAYRNFCTQLANQESVTLYAYLYERQGNTCVQPLSTVDGIVYDRFELYAPTDIWSTGFCADKDIRIQ